MVSFKGVIHFFLVKDKKFIVFFIITYLILVLFFNYAYHIDSFINERAFVGNMEPTYHFLLRYVGIIEGGEFKEKSKDFSLIIGAFLYPLIPLYVVEVVMFRIFLKIKGIQRFDKRNGKSERKKGRFY